MIVDVEVLVSVDGGMTLVTVVGIVLVMVLNRVVLGMLIVTILKLVTVNVEVSVTV